ncbi:hypothetical protein [Chelativorans sp. AA-79]|uniref:hypothetical protein n=1 Tax=Chelativorans sp. AA-79 TaxID=3028735 RepID=UPI0023F90122|nr:hypothetical protein [Chelativorans sp. AA-79]WEX07508.1 hypothetical protein PVE73_15440 [Chelativorans sp. AA-79]
METFIVAVRCAENGEIVCFPADYLNGFPLWCRPPRLSKAGSGRYPHVQIDGCNATGWFDHLPDQTNGTIISPMLLGPHQYIVGWCPIEDMAPSQQRTGGHSAMHLADAGAE